MHVLILSWVTEFLIWSVRLDWAAWLSSWGLPSPRRQRASCGSTRRRASWCRRRTSRCERPGKPPPSPATASTGTRRCPAGRPSAGLKPNRTGSSDISIVPKFRKPKAATILCKCWQLKGSPHDFGVMGLIPTDTCPDNLLILHDCRMALAGLTNLAMAQKWSNYSISSCTIRNSAQRYRTKDLVCYDLNLTP